VVISDNECADYGKECSVIELLTTMSGLLKKESESESLREWLSIVMN